MRRHLCCRCYGVVTLVVMVSLLLLMRRHLADVNNDGDGATGDNDDCDGNGALGHDDDDVNNDVTYGVIEDNCDFETGDEVDNNGDGSMGYNDDNNGDRRQCRRQQHSQLEGSGTSRGGGA